MTGAAVTARPSSSDGILRRAGSLIVDGRDRPQVLRGVAFGNQVWSGRVVPDGHHGAVDFQRVRAFGMNAVRFYLHFATLEDQPNPPVFRAEGWRWLDQNIDWARQAGVYLVLNVHVPPGGFQSSGEGEALWEVLQNQDRLVAIWRAIAARYAGEPVIAGYDLLNEPAVTKSKAQWTTLATRIAAAIREVDKEHLLIVERVNSIAGQWTNDQEMNFCAIDDPNTAYTFHFYEPIEYSHQLTSWTGLGEGGKYPDQARLAGTANAKWLGIATFGAPTLPPGDSPWTYVQGPRLTSLDKRATIGRVSLVGRQVGGGRALFGDVVVDEFDQRGEHVAAIVRLSPTGLQGFYLWSADSTGRSGLETAGGPQGTAALTIEATTADANLSARQYDFPLTPGHGYAARGWMRGERLPADAVVQIRLDVLAGDGAVTCRNKAYLAAQLGRYLEWGRTRNVPLILGELGLHRPCFDEGRGGLAWVEDMLDLARDHRLAFIYHAYHEDAFGIFRGDGPVDPTRANRELIRLFERKLEVTP